MIEKPNKQMRGVNRRRALQGILGGTVVVTMGLIVPPKVVEAVPLTATKDAFTKPRVFSGADSLVEEAQVVVTRPRRRHWVCWWRRGRRVCGWRWV